MKELFKKVLDAEALYNSAVFDFNNAPRGNSWIDMDIAETLKNAESNYKSVLVEAITALANELMHIPQVQNER